MLPVIEPVIKVIKPFAAVTEPVNAMLTSPPEDVPAAVDLPASRKIALVVLSVVLMALLTVKLPSVTKLIFPLVRLMVLSTVSALLLPVITALTLPVPEMALAMEVAIDRA